MRIKSLILASAVSASAVFADPGHGMDQGQKLCPNYGTNREGSMFTDGYGPFVTGEFLYWTSQIDGLDLVYAEQQIVSQTGSVSSKQKITRPNFDWDPALRVALGYYFDWMDWALKLEWTRLRSDVNTSKDRPEGYDMNSLWGRVGTNSPLDLQRISSRWGFAYDTLDLTLRPGYFRYRYFALQPEFGLRGAWIDWKYDINSTYDSQGTSLALKQKNKNDFHAIGLIAKVNMKWFMGWGFHIYANALASALYGQFDVSMPSNLVTTGLDLSRSFSEKYWRVRSNVHLALGLEWERFFMDNGLRLNIHAGYEFLNWFNQNQLQRLRIVPFGTDPILGEVYPFVERDDVSLSGFTVGAGLEF